MTGGVVAGSEGRLGERALTHAIRAGDVGDVEDAFVADAALRRHGRATRSTGAAATSSGATCTARPAGAAGTTSATGTTGPSCAATAARSALTARTTVAGVSSVVLITAVGLVATVGQSAPATTASTSARVQAGVGARVLLPAARADAASRFVVVEVIDVGTLCASGERRGEGECSEPGQLSRLHDGLWYTRARSNVNRRKRPDSSAYERPIRNATMPTPSTPAANAPQRKPAERRELPSSSSWAFAKASRILASG